MTRKEKQARDYYLQTLQLRLARLRMEWRYRRQEMSDEARFMMAVAITSTERDVQEALAMR